MGAIWALGLLASVVLLVVSAVATIFRRVRQKGKWGALLAGCLIFIFGFQLSKVSDEEAKQAGWASNTERTTAKVAGISDVATWRQHQSDLAAAEVAQAAEAQARKLAVTAAREELLRQPTAQLRLVEAAQQGRARYRAAETEMQKGAARPARAVQICKSLTKRRVTDWVGTISRLSTNGDGKGVFGVEIAANVHVSTYNNALSDIGSDTLIEPGTPLYNALLTMKEGAIVRFAGTFFTGDTDCILEKSLTLGGSLDDPDFLFSFSDVAPIVLPPT